MEISVIGSGSNGNSCLVEDKNTSVIIDAGFSCREIESRLNRLGKSLENVNAVVLSHSHSDHCRGVGIISRKYDIPVYLSKKVHEGVYLDAKTKHFHNSFKINGLKIEPIRTSHDVPSFGFRIGKFGIFTDTGIVTPDMERAVRGLKTVIIESNHDVDMLLNGPYPAFLKNRIFSDTGHLSNIQASSFVNNFGKELETALLGHLSANNNTVYLAKNTFDTLVKQKIECTVLSRQKETGTWTV
jgi:phosphoribosyl 1,2-cyclic phosphodiesterase